MPLLHHYLMQNFYSKKPYLGRHLYHASRNVISWATSPSLFKSQSGCVCIGLFSLCKLVLCSDSFKDSGFVIGIPKSIRFRFDIRGKIQISQRLLDEPSYIRIFLHFLFENLCWYLLTFHLHGKKKYNFFKKALLRGKMFHYFFLRHLSIIMAVAWRHFSHTKHWKTTWVLLRSA